MSAPLRVIPLGGLGEIGLNALVLEWDGHLLLLDAGMLFPSADMPGVDSVVPDFEYLAERADRLLGERQHHGPTLTSPRTLHTHHRCYE